MENLIEIRYGRETQQVTSTNEKYIRVIVQEKDNEADL